MPQRKAVNARLSQSLFLVAGPGSGKTTCSALRLLKLIFVDGVKAEQILATTFTRKAATALRSKLVEYGEGLRDHLKAQTKNVEFRRRMDQIDLNAMRLGTIDSIAQDLLTEFRPAAAPPPRPIEEFARASIFLLDGVLGNGLHNSRRAIPAVYKKLYGRSIPPGAAARAALLQAIYDRCANDLVNTKKWKAACTGNDDYSRGVLKALDAIESVRQRYKEEHVCDFAAQSEALLQALKSGKLALFLNNLKFVFIDEYQDTNLLQENIYFYLARSACGNGGALCVVGDDDQSIYRFRGATVDLFQNFPTRAQKYIGVTPQRLELVCNFRSTPEIINFVNDYVGVDPAFKNGRIKPPKPRISATRAGSDAPVIGIFAPTKNDLAVKLACFINKVVNGRGVKIGTGKEAIKIVVDRKAGGSPHDIALLMSSVREKSTTGKPRLPLLLREELKGLKKPIKIFNPRGQNLTDQNNVQLLLGLALLCIDPDGTAAHEVKTSRSKQEILLTWRSVAQQHLQNRAPLDLRSFVMAWQSRTSTRSSSRDRPNRISDERVNLNEIFYKLLSWIPELQYDVEQLALLEAIARTVASAAIFASYDCDIIFGKRPLADDAAQSVKSALQSVFVPLAEGVIDISEDLLDTLPRDRVSLLTIHQAKGLEFPITIVDVGSDGENLNSFRSSRRFPDDPAAAHLFEDELRRYCTLQPPRRKAIDRAFDDLVRQYYVAYSRPQDVLVLAGVDRCIDIQEPIHNVATGWRRPPGRPSCAWPQLSNIVMWNAT